MSLSDFLPSLFNNLDAVAVDKTAVRSFSAKIEILRASFFYNALMLSLDCIIVFDPEIQTIKLSSGLSSRTLVFFH